MKTETLTAKTTHIPKPKWLRVKLPTGKKYTELRGLVDKYNLHTICTSGCCPNMGECWGEGTATFMILGNICTRSCGFCGVQTGRPKTVDWAEPEKVARSIKIMKIKHAVLTSPTSIVNLWEAAVCKIMCRPNFDNAGASERTGSISGSVKPFTTSLALGFRPFG